MLVAIALADLFGAGFAIADVLETPSAETSPTVLIRLQQSKGKPADWSVLVISRRSETVRSQSLRRGQAAMALSLEPGEYLVSAGGSSICRRKIDVVSTPLQTLTLRC